MPKTETVPSPRLATSASVPSALMDRPAGDFPASSSAITLGGETVRSMTERRLSGTCLVGSAGGDLLDDATNARFSAGGPPPVGGGPGTRPRALSPPRRLRGAALRA